MKVFQLSHLIKRLYFIRYLRLKLFNTRPKIQPGRRRERGRLAVDGNVVDAPIENRRVAWAQSTAN